MPPNGSEKERCPKISGLLSACQELHANDRRASNGDVAVSFGKYQGFSMLGEYVKSRSYLPTDIEYYVRNDGSLSTGITINE